MFRPRPKTKSIETQAHLEGDPKGGYSNAPTSHLHECVVTKGFATGETGWISESCNTIAAGYPAFAEVPTRRIYSFRISFRMVPVGPAERVGETSGG